jgi:hypothetical protein
MSIPLIKDDPASAVRYPASGDMNLELSDEQTAALAGLMFSLRRNRLVGSYLFFRGEEAAEVIAVGSLDPGAFLGIQVVDIHFPRSRTAPPPSRPVALGGCLTNT